MPQVVYTRWDRALSGGGQVSFTWSGPSVFVPGRARELLAPALGQVGLTIAGYLVRLAQDAYHEEPMRSRWEPVTQVGPGLSVFAGTGTNDPIFPFLEWDVKGHWMPWGPGSRFAAWAGRVGVQNVYRAARAYALTNHPGRHLMPKVLAQAAQFFSTELQAAVREVLST